MFCDKCGNALNDGDLFCTKCGNKVSVQQPVPQEPVEAAPTPEAEAKAPKAGGNNKIKFILGGIAAAVVVVAVVVIACLPYITNFVKKTFSEPEEYYAYVEQNTAKSTAKSVASVYEQLVENVNLYDRNYAGSINVELTESGEDLLSLVGLAGMDLSWLQSGTLEFEGGVKNNVWNGDAGIALNGDDIISANIIFSLTNQELYAQIPELGKKYLGLEEDELDTFFDLDDDIMEEMVDNAELNKAIVKALPSASKVEKLVKKYMNIVYSNMSDVKMREKTLRAEGISQECTELEATIDSEVVRDILEAVLNEMKEDQEIKAIIEDIADAYGEDPDEAYSEFLREIQYELDNVDFSVSNLNEATLTIWVDNAGNVVGRSYEVENYYGTTETKWIMPKQGSKFGFECSNTEYGTTISMVGTGKESGSKLSGDFEIEYNGTALVEIGVKNFNTKKAEKGFINGEFTVTLASGIGSLLGMNSGTSMLTDAQLVISTEMSASKVNAEITLIYDEETAATITVVAKSGKGTSVSVPKDKNIVFVEDEDDFEDWTEEMDYEKFVEKLSKTDLPEDFIEALEEYDNLKELIEDLY